MKKLLFIFLVLFPIALFAQDNTNTENEKIEKKESIFKDLRPDIIVKYIVRLKNGDLLTGYITEFVSDKEFGEGIKLKTQLGTPTIYESEILDIRPVENFYRHRHRIFLMPTAEPIKKDYFIGSFELLFLYAGFGISDLLSFTAGRTIIPAIDSRHQASIVNGKITFLKVPFKSMKSVLNIAAGVNFGWANHNNRFIHQYINATFRMTKSSFTAMVFHKSGAEDFYILRFANDAQSMFYDNGAFGVGLALDTKLNGWHGLHFIGEIWNTNIERPTHSAVFLGFRHSTSNVSADFGLAFFTTPFAAPFVSFVWTPFN